MTRLNPRNPIPVPTLRRLPSYLQALKLFVGEGREFVSCASIAGRFGQDNTQVQKDLAAIGIEGRQRVGYKTDALMRAIEDFLGWNNVTDAFLVGAGNLGSALLGYKGFEERGLQIVAAFDADPAKAGTRIHDKPVFSIDDLPRLALRMKVRIGILAVPDAAAQQTAEMLVQGGVKGIWNFTAASLDVPAEVCVQNEDLAGGLAVLSSRLSRERDGGRRGARESSKKQGI